MIPLADIVAFSTSVSNHWSRKSTALIVMSWTWLYRSSGARPRNRRPRNARRPSSRGFSDHGSGGVMSRIGFTKRAISTIASEYSS